jgi:hypothetical protein
MILKTYLIIRRVFPLQAGVLESVTEAHENINSCRYSSAGVYII